MTTLKQRFAMLAKERPDISRSDLARATGAKPPSVHAWYSGDTKTMKADTAAKAAALYGCNPVWLATGAGSMFDPSAADAVAEPVQAFAVDETRELVIPQYDTGGSMGHGLELEEMQPGLIRSWRVDLEWVRLNVRHYTSLKNLCIVTGFGPSMQTKYNPGDPLLCDSGVKTVQTDGVYFFRVGKHGFIKQLQRIPTESGMVLRAKSFNQDYDPFDITEKMDFEVFGQILTVWRSEQL